MSVSTREALASLKEAEQRMDAAALNHRAFIEQPDRQYTAEEHAEGRRLHEAVNRSIAEYWQAFERCKG